MKNHENHEDEEHEIQKSEVNLLRCCFLCHVRQKDLLVGAKYLIPIEFFRMFFKCFYFKFG